MSDSPGWYCFRAVPTLAEWDGTAWSGNTHYTSIAPELPGPPRPFAFLRQSWPWWMILGQVLVIVPAIISGYTGNGFWSWSSFLGYTAFMIGTVEVVIRYLPTRRLAGLRSLTVIGIVCGLVGFGLAFWIESFTVHAFGDSTTLWLTGPIEEGGKLLVPFLLLAFGGGRFKNPLAGLYLVLVSGATVGAVEGTEWQARVHHPWYHLQLAMIRPAAELPHVFVTGFAGALIWLAAWRCGRAVTGAGVLAFLIAVAIHSFHDGFITLFGVDPHPAVSSIARSIGQAFATGAAGSIFAIGIGIASFVLGRHACRELSPPGAVADCPPPWRPQIKTWGCRNPVRVEAPNHTAYVPAPQPSAAYGAYWAPGSHGPALYPGAVMYGQAQPAYGHPTYPSYPGPTYGGPNGGTRWEQDAAMPPALIPPFHPSPPVAVPDLLPLLGPPPGFPGLARPPVAQDHAAEATTPAVVVPTPSPPPLVAPRWPPMAVGPGWYPVQGDPHRTAWWDGTRWTNYQWWDGVAWRPA